MKIIIVVHQFLPKFTAGTEVLAFSVAKELVFRGANVIVMAGAPADGPLSDIERFSQYEVDGIKVHQFSHQLVLMGKQDTIMEIEYSNNLASNYFSDLIDDFQPDLIHVFHMARFGAGIVDVAKSKGVKIYFTPTDFWSVCPISRLMYENGRSCSGPRRQGANCIKHLASMGKAGLIRRFAKYCPVLIINMAINFLRIGGLKKFIPFGREVVAISDRQNYILTRLNAMDGILSPTDTMTHKLILHGVLAEKISQKMYGIDISNYKSSFRDFGLGRRLNIGFIGSLMPHKGCHVLIDALAFFDSDLYSLKIYGDTSECPDYFERISAKVSKMPSVEFCGVFHNSAIGDVFSGIDVLVVPSLWLENAPLVVHSALSAGCPVIASNFSGLSEIIKNGVNGILFDPGNVADLVRSIRILLNDRQLLNRLSKNCRPPKSISIYVDEMLELWGREKRALN